MGGGLDVAHVERLDVGRVVEDIAELAGESIDLVVGQLEAGQAGNVDDLFTGEPFGHGPKGYAAAVATSAGVIVPLVHPFLSPEWIVAVRQIRDEYRHHVGSTEIEIRANVTITETPFDDPHVKGHIDTTGGALTLDEGHLDEHDFGIEMSYSVAHQIFIDRDPQAVVGILVGGQVKLTGDSSKLLLLAGMASPPAEGSAQGDLAREVIRRIDEVTATPD